MREGKGKIVTRKEFIKAVTGHKITGVRFIDEDSFGHTFTDLDDCLCIDAIELDNNKEIGFAGSGDIGEETVCVGLEDKWVNE